MWLSVAEAFNFELGIENFASQASLRAVAPEGMSRAGCFRALETLPASDCEHWAQKHKKSRTRKNTT